jgi:TM2 domain-containing membrane protein YozV
MSEESNTPAPESATPPTPPPAQAFSKEQTDKKLIAGLLGLSSIIWGGFGIHKFYLGYTKEGIIQLALTLLCGVGAIIGIIEGILYLTKTDDEFVKTYVVGRKGWF